MKFPRAGNRGIWKANSKGCFRNRETMMDEKTPSVIPPNEVVFSPPAKSSGGQFRSLPLMETGTGLKDSGTEPWLQMMLWRMLRRKDMIGFLMIPCFRLLKGCNMPNRFPCQTHRISSEFQEFPSESSARAATRTQVGVFWDGRNSPREQDGISSGILEKQ